MRAIRTAFQIAPKTQDEEFADRKRALGDLNDALQSYERAMQKVKANVKSAVQSLLQVRAVFEDMKESSYLPSVTVDLITQFSSSVDVMKEDYLEVYTNAMDGDVLPALLDLRKLSDECAHYESKRNKAMREYDLYRNEVVKKENSYAKKNKDLSASRVYNADVAKRNDLRETFDTADSKFKGCHEQLVQMTGSVLNHCMTKFFDCSASFSNRIAHEFEGLLTSSRDAFQYSSDNESKSRYSESEDDETD